MESVTENMEPVIKNLIELFKKNLHSETNIEIDDETCDIIILNLTHAINESGICDINLAKKSIDPSDSVISKKKTKSKNTSDQLQATTQSKPSKPRALSSYNKFTKQYSIYYTLHNKTDIKFKLTDSAQKWTTLNASDKALFNSDEPTEETINIISKLIAT